VLDPQIRHFYCSQEQVAIATCFCLLPLESLMQNEFHPPKYISQSAAAEFLSVSERTIARWVRQGKLRAFQLNNVTRITKEDFEQFIAQYTDEKIVVDKEGCNDV
jgi:excisionase family DNA binding protein